MKKKSLSKYKIKVKNESALKTFLKNKESKTCTTKKWLVIYVPFLDSIQWHSWRWHLLIWKIYWKWFFWLFQFCTQYKKWCTRKIKSDGKKCWFHISKKDKKEMQVSFQIFVKKSTFKEKKSKDGQMILKYARKIMFFLLSYFAQIRYQVNFQHCKNKVFWCIGMRKQQKCTKTHQKHVKNEIEKNK